MGPNNDAHCLGHPSQYHGLSLAFGCHCWLMTALCWLALAFVGCCWPVVACIGLHWLSLACGGLHWPLLAFVGLC